MTPQQFIASLFVLLAIIGGGPRAHAANVGKAAGQAIEKTGANTASAVIKNGGTSSTFADLLSKPSALARDSEGGLLMSDLLKMPFKPQDIGTVTSRISAANIARGLMGLGTAYLAGEALEALGKEACVRLMGGTWQMNAAGTWEECVPGSGGTGSTPSDGYRYTVDQWASSGPWYPSAVEACRAWAATYVGTETGNGKVLAVTNVSADSSGSSYGKCFGDVTYRYGASEFTGTNSYINNWGRSQGTCPAGQHVWSDGSCHSEPQVQEVTYKPISQDAAQSKLEEAIKAISNSQKVIEAVRDMLNKGGTVEVDSPTITGPETGQPTTTTGTQQVTTRNPDGSTSTSTVNITNTTVNHYTYNGAQVTARSVSTTSKTDGQGNTTEETTESDPEEAPTDTPMPPIPKLYERKYPDGMVGIWHEQSEQLKQSGLFQLAQQLMPQVPDGGQCPSFKVPLNYANWANFGEGDVSPPCWIWDFGRVVILICAGLLARRLIFGG